MFHQASADKLCGDRPRAQPTVRSRRRLADEDALQAGWDWLLGNMNEGKDVAASEVVGVVRALCPGADLAFIREGLWRRLMESGLAFVSPEGAKPCDSIPADLS